MSLLSHFSAAIRFYAVLFASALFLVLLSSISANAQGSGGKKWALLIGIDDYKDHTRINSLGAAAADARSLKATLIEVGGFAEENVRLLVSDADTARREAFPERSVILGELGALAQHVHPGDTVLVLYSGHGIEVNGKSYLLPYDTEAIDINTMLETAIETATFKKRLQAVKAGVLILAFDMCRTSPRKGAKGVALPNPLTSGQVTSVSLSRPAALPGIDTPPIAVTLFACMPKQQSFEWGDKGRGYFSFYLEQGLRGYASDALGTVRLDKLAEYVERSVKDAVQREERKEQVPFFEGPSLDELRHVVLATNVFPTAPPVLDRNVHALAVETDAQFHVSVTPASATVLVDGAPQSSRVVSVNLGLEKSRTVEVRAEAPGLLAVTRKVTLVRGINPPVNLDLGGDDTGGNGGAAAAANIVSAPDSGQPSQEDLTPRLRLTADGGASASAAREDDGSIKVTIASVTSVDWRVRATCGNVRLSEGHRYAVRFRARANQARKIGVQCRTGDGDLHLVGLDQSVNMGTGWQTYRLEFVAARVSKSGMNLAPYLVLGSHAGAVWLAEIALETLD